MSSDDCSKYSCSGFQMRIFRTACFRTLPSDVISAARADDVPTSTPTKYILGIFGLNFTKWMMGGWVFGWMDVCLWALSVVPIRRNRRKNFPPSVAGLFCTPYHLRLQMQFKKQIPLWCGALCVGWAAAAMLMSAELYIWEPEEYYYSIVNVLECALFRPLRLRQLSYHFYYYYCNAYKQFLNSDLCTISLDYFPIRPTCCLSCGPTGDFGWL